MTVTMEAKGPLFDGSAKNIINIAINALERDIANAGVKKLQEMLRPSPGGVLKSSTEAGRDVSTGEYRKSIHSLVSNMLVEIEDDGAVYGPWLEGESSRNSTTRFKGYASFRKVKQWLEDEYIPGKIAEYENKLADSLNG